MPIKTCTLEDGSSGYKWGDEGKCYSDRKDAEAQGAAIEASKEETKKSIKEAFEGFLEKHFGGSSEEVVQEEFEEVTKAVDTEQRMALFIAMEPDVVDAHGDITSEAEVEKACHNFNRANASANLYHMVDTEHAEVVQSYIAPTNFTLDNGQEIRKGTWLMQFYFPETEEGEAIWKDVKSGELNGISIGAMAKVEEIEND